MIDRSRRRALVLTPMETDRRVVVEAAVLAERLGYEAVIVPEGSTVAYVHALSLASGLASRSITNRPVGAPARNDPCGVRTMVRQA